MMGRGGGQNIWEGICFGKTRCFFGRFGKKLRCFLGGYPPPLEYFVMCQGGGGKIFGRGGYFMARIYVFLGGNIPTQIFCNWPGGGQNIPLLGLSISAQQEITAYKLSVSCSGARRSYRPDCHLTLCGSAAAVLSGYHLLKRPAKRLV